MEEVWKDIKGYDGYQVSNLGRVRTLNKITYSKLHGERHWKNRILKEKRNKKSRMVQVTLYKNGIGTSYLVHRLVGEAFIPNPENKPQVNHIDTNKSNNNVNNLEWSSRSENMIHAYSHNLINSHTEKKRISQLNNIKIAREYLRRKNNAKNRNTL